MRLAICCALSAVLMLFLTSCAPSGENAREEAPQEFACEVSITCRDFTAQAVLERTVRGEYALRYLSPETIQGLSYSWIAGEISCGLHDAGEVTGVVSDSLFPLLIEACEVYYRPEQECLSMERGEGKLRFVHKEFTIEANPQNGAILSITFPDKGITVQMKEEMKP